jgi:Tyrosyl-tRNA synthetase
MVKSRSEGRNLIAQNGVRLNEKPVSEWNTELEAGVLQVGKRKFLRLVKPG